MNSAEVLESKKILSNLRVPAKSLLALGSVGIFFVSASLFFLRGNLDFYNISFIHWAAFGAILACSYFYNFLYYNSLKRGRLSEVEPIAMTAPIFSILLAAIVFPDERNFHVLIPAFIAGLSMVYSHIERKHLKVNKSSLAMLGFVLLIAIESIFVKYTLEVMSPIALYTLRIGILSVIFLLVIQPNIKKISKKAWGRMGLISLIVPIEYVSFYSAIEKIGIVRTSLIFLLAPVLILIGSRLFFGEKMSIKKIVTNIVIIICVAASIIIS